MASKQAIFARAAAVNAAKEKRVAGKQSVYDFTESQPQLCCLRGIVRRVFEDEMTRVRVYEVEYYELLGPLN